MRPFLRCLSFRLGVAGGACLAMGLLSLGDLTGATADDRVLPDTPPSGRFDALAAVSPFAPPSAPTPLPAPVTTKTSGLAQDYLLSGVAQVGTKYRVTLTRRNADAGTYNHVTVATGEANPEQIVVVSVDWSEDPSGTRVKLRKGAEEAVLTYDATTLAPVANTAPQPTPGTGRAGAAGAVPPIGGPVNRFNPAASNSPSPAGAVPPNVARPRGRTAPIYAAPAPAAAPVFAPPALPPNAPNATLFPQAPSGRIFDPATPQSIPPALPLIPGD